MNRVTRLIQFAVGNFGPLIVFYATNAYFGTREAILAAVLFSIAEIIYKLVKKETFTSFFKFSVIITVVFSIVDLSIKTPIFFRYESVITNIITGMYFGMTLWSKKSFIQEWVEKKNGTPMLDPNSIFRSKVMTGVWCAYFFIKAGSYFYINEHYSLEAALIIRSTVGMASFYILFGISIFFGKSILVFLQKNGILPTISQTELE